ncbi:hypothetical protein THAOC_12537, partial [Thalassiosira oceanica]
GQSRPSWAPSPNWLNADEKGVDARRHVAFRIGSPKSLRAPRAVVTRFLAHARFQTAPTSLLTLQTCGGGLRLGRVKIMNSRTGTAACIGRAGPFSVSEREEAVRPQIEFSAVDLSPEMKDLQHRLEVLALATDGEESCPMEGRPFQRLTCFHPGPIKNPDRANQYRV